MAYYHRYFALLLTVSVFVVELHAGHPQQTLLAEEFLSADRPLKCQRMKSRYGRMCESFGYNMTRMPNLLNHQKQREAFAHMQGYSHLIESQCSSELSFLLCTFHFPMCSIEEDPSSAPALMTPCRGLCERVRDSCLPTMIRHGFTWPEQMKCEKLQHQPLITTVEGERVACVDRPFLDVVTAPPTCRPITCDQAKLKKKTFSKSQFHFALEGTFLGSFLLNDRKELQVRLTRIHHFCSRVPAEIKQLTINSMISLRTDQSDLCMCPDLEIGHTYLFTGHIDRRGRLMVKAQKSIMMTLTKPAAQIRKVTKWMKRFCKKYTPNFLPVSQRKSTSG